MNEYVNELAFAGATEWVITFPTKNFYVDAERLSLDLALGFWHPDPTDPGCGGWVPGDDFPKTKGPNSSEPIDGPGPWPNDTLGQDWSDCSYVFLDQLEPGEALEPFTELFDSKSCDPVTLQTWDREEDTFEPGKPGGSRPPVVSPAPPNPCDPELQNCGVTPFELCYEVNVLRFGDPVLFATPEIEGQSLLLEIDNEFENGWGRINMGGRGLEEEEFRRDFVGLVGLPVTGFAAERQSNGFLTDDAGEKVKAFYGGVFGHKGNVRRVGPPLCDQGGCGSFIIIKSD